MFPRRIGTYLNVNLALAVLMAIVMAERAKLRSGRLFFIDILLIMFYASVLASVFVVPFALIEIYLYSKKKGFWYEWKNKARRPLREVAMSPVERQYWKSEAYRARLAKGVEPAHSHCDRTRLFESNNAGEPVSRAALLMNVAQKLERSGKREAAERCYLQITERFADSPEAREAARWLSTATKV